jgi:hypothetical protein
MDHNPSPLIIALADIAGAKEDKPFTEVMDLVEDLLVETMGFEPTTSGLQSPRSTN